MLSSFYNNLDQPDAQGIRRGISKGIISKGVNKGINKGISKGISKKPYSDSCASGDERHGNRYGETPQISGEKKFPYKCGGNLKNGDPWGCGRAYSEPAGLYRHFQHLGYCIRPLLLEEGLAEHNQKATASGNPASYTSQKGTFRLPASLLARYPALAQIDRRAGVEAHTPGQKSKHPKFSEPGYTSDNNAHDQASPMGNAYDQACRTMRIQALPSGILQYGLVITTNLSLLHYIKRNFPKERVDLSTLVTITGTSFCAYGTTCLNYLESTWPGKEDILLPILQDSIQEVLDQPNSTITVDMMDPSESLAIEAKLPPDGRLTIHAKGSCHDIIVMVQQLSWLTATFSMLQPGEEGTTYCTPVFNTIYDQTQNETILRLDTSFAKLDIAENSSCWLSLFSPAVIAQGFPIPKRKNSIGLEMSIELMAAIVGARHAAEFDGGVVIKGFSSMFLPVSRVGDEIQWHYVANSDPNSQLTYYEGVKRCPNRSLLPDIDIASLEIARCFVGWNSLVEIRVGSETDNFENIEFSDTKEVKRTLQIPSASIGFQQFALAQINVTFGKRDGKCHFQRGSSYRRIVSASESMFIVLFDAGERRSYLVTASRLLLHILRHRMSLGLGGVPATKVKIASAGSTTETLLQNARLRISSEEDEPIFLEDVVSEIWSILELLQAQSTSAEKNAPLEIHSTWHEHLLGYEYMAIVKDWSPMPLKQLEIHKTCGGWPRLARDIDALVLLGKGFGDLIQPVDNENLLCHQWKTLPRQKDYMAVPVEILLDLYSSAGCRQTKKRLTSTDLQLHGEGASFQPCPEPTEDQCSCDRSHQVIRRSSFGEICVPELTEERGAVVIGDHRSFLKRFSMRSTPKTTRIYNLANTMLDSDTFANRNPDTSFLSESSDLRYSSTTSPESSNNDSRGSLGTLNSTRGTFRKILDKEKCDRSEITDPAAILCPTWTPSPNPTKGPTLGGPSLLRRKGVNNLR